MAEGMRDERDRREEGGRGGGKPSHEFFMKIRKPIVNMPPSRPGRRGVRGRRVKKEEASVCIIIVIVITYYIVVSYFV